MKCIYCLRNSGVTFRGVEHVVPQAFGTFASNTPVLDCVCDDCNAYFGRELDHLLARETFEGISRYTRGRPSSATRRQRRLNIALASSPEAGDFEGFRVDVDGRTGRLMRPRAQFHVFNFQTNENEVYFIEQFPRLALPEAVYGKPAKDGAKGTWRVKAFAASKEEHDELVAALQAVGIDYQAGESIQLPQADDAGDELSFLVKLEGVVDKQHKRALTKILMNFVTWVLGCDEVLKPRWDFLRAYVRHATGEIKARIDQQAFWSGQETDEQRFPDDSIDIRVKNLDGNIVGSIQFYGNFTYQMILAEGDALPADSEIGYRFTPGLEPIRGEKRSVAALPKE